MKSKLVIVQPALGRYRKGFVESLNIENSGEYDINIYCSKVDDAGVKSMEFIPKEISYTFVSLTSIFGVFFWQSLVLEIVKLNLSHRDTFVFNGNPRYLSSIFLAFYLKLKRVDVIWWGHAFSSTSSKFGSFIRFKLMSFFRVIFYTDEEVINNSKRLNTKMCGINNGLDIDSIRNDFCFCTKKYQNITQCKLAFIGRATSKSNIKLLIEALINIKRLGNVNFQLDIVGDVSPEHLALIDINVSELNINFLGSMWEEKDISAALSDSHVFVYPGAVGLSIIHAFGLGLPAIVHDNVSGHMPEIASFTNGLNGMSFKDGSSDDLSKVLIEMFSDSDRLCRMSINAFNTVSHTFNTKDMAYRFIDFVRNKNV